MDNRYLFVDGGSLRETIALFESDLYGGVKVDVDYRRVGHGYRKIFYYDCLPALASTEGKSAAEKQVLEDAHQKRHDEQERLFAHLQTLDGWHVVEGYSKPRRRRQMEQKEVDVLIAVDMLSHTHRKNMDAIGFITGDQDFRPLVEAVVREGMFITLLFEPRHTGLQLINAADAREPITPILFNEWLTREFQGAHGLPSYGGLGRPEDVGGTEIESWKSGEVDVRLFLNGATYYIVRAVPSLMSRNYQSPLFQLHHTDPGLLRRVHDVWFKPDDLRAANQTD